MQRGFPMRGGGAGYRRSLTKVVVHLPSRKIGGLSALGLAADLLSSVPSTPHPNEIFTLSGQTVAP